MGSFLLLAWSFYHPEKLEQENSMCVTVWLFHAPPGCGIHVVPPQVYTCRWRLAGEGIVPAQMGPKTESRGIPTDSHLIPTYFIFVIFSMQCYVCPNAISFEAEGIQNQQGMSGCYRDQEVHTMLLSVWTWQCSDVMAGRTMALCVCKGMTWWG